MASQTGSLDILRRGDARGTHHVREDHVLDEELPLWVPIPALAEMQVALEQAVGEVTGLSGFELKRVMRTGTVASVDNRNWELGGQGAIIRRLSQSRAVALDMESAAVAANGFRDRRRRRRRRHPASGFPGSWKIATIHASSGVIWGMSADA